MIKKCAVFLCVFVSVLVLELNARSTAQVPEEPRTVVLVGASVGRAWDIPALPERTGVKDYVFEYEAGGGFDKSNALQRILSREGNKPDAIFIKECAAYFPGDLERFKGLMKGWIALCEQEGVVPIPATVVPVTRLHSFKKILIDLIKGRGFMNEGNPFEYSRNAAILAYNDWIKAYAAGRGLSVLDMEKAVVYGPDNRFLREDYARLDGLHINSRAYVSLDSEAILTLVNVDWNQRGEE